MKNPAAKATIHIFERICSLSVPKACCSQTSERLPASQTAHQWMCRVSTWPPVQVAIPPYSPFPVQSSPVLSLSLHAAEGHRHDTNHCAQLPPLLLLTFPLEP